MEWIIKHDDDDNGPLYIQKIGDRLVHKTIADIILNDPHISHFISKQTLQQIQFYKKYAFAKELNSQFFNIIFICIKIIHYFHNHPFHK